MEEPAGQRGKPDSSELFVTKVAFADGRILSMLDIEGCDFTF